MPLPVFLITDCLTNEVVGLGVCVGVTDVAEAVRDGIAPNITPQHNTARDIFLEAGIILTLFASGLCGWHKGYLRWSFHCKYQNLGGNIKTCRYSSGPACFFWCQIKIAK